MTTSPDAIVGWLEYMFHLAGRTTDKTRLKYCIRFALPFKNDQGMEI